VKAEVLNTEVGVIPDDRVKLDLTCERRLELPRVDAVPHSYARLAC
jgi:hypothetical protein